MRRRLCLVAMMLAAAATAVAQTEETPRQPESPSGFVAKPQPEGAPRVVAIPPGHDARMWRALDRLVTALDNEDRAGFVALMSAGLVARHEKAQDPITEMYDFMERAMARRGGIAAFHALSDKAYEVPDSAFPMRPAVFHLEDGLAGYFGLALDDDDRIDHFSLILKPEICAAGTECTKGVGLPHEMSGE